MKHIFIINPSAGKQDSTTEITHKVESYASANGDFEYSIYTTQCSGDATRWVRRWCADHPGIPVRFYSCGGDISTALSTAHPTPST